MQGSAPADEDLNCISGSDLSATPNIRYIYFATLYFIPSSN